MTTPRAERLQAGLDALRAAAPDCRLAMLADLRTGLVLRRAGEDRLAQEEFDEALRGAGSVAALGLTRVLLHAAAPDTVLHVNAYAPQGTLTLTLGRRLPDEALVCRHRSRPDRIAARAVFEAALDPGVPA